MERHRTLYACLKLACRVPGVRTLTRGVARWTIGNTPLSLKNRQRICNLVAPAVSPGVRTRAKIRLPDSGHIEVMLNLDEDMDRNWYFMGYAGYESELRTLLLRLVRERGYRGAIEVGANIGYFSLMIASAMAKNGPDARLHAFEPFGPVFESLQTNASLNPHLPITLHRVAATDFDGQVNLFIPKDERAKTNASLVAGLFEQEGANLVPAQKLDTFAEKVALNPLHLVKMDCEGAEPAVLRGAQKLLRESRADVICEVLPPTADELDRLFTDLGYLKYHVTSAGAVRVERIIADPQHRDYFLTHTELPAISSAPVSTPAASA